MHIILCNKLIEMMNKISQDCERVQCRMSIYNRPNELASADTFSNQDIDAEPERLASSQQN